MNQPMHGVEIPDGEARDRKATVVGVQILTVMPRTGPRGGLPPAARVGSRQPLIGISLWARCADAR
jgi:hypothetical protein